MPTDYPPMSEVRYTIRADFTPSEFYKPWKDKPEPRWTGPEWYELYDGRGDTYGYEGPGASGDLRQYLMDRGLHPECFES